MNHAGRDQRLVEIAEPDVRVWTNVGDAHLGFFASPEAIADAKAEILERAAPDTAARLQRRRSAGHGAGGRFPGRTDDVRDVARCATVRAGDVEDLGLDGMRARSPRPKGRP
jgi:UDP-N-acetylmuramyl pentapeptide synthase